MKFVLKFNRIQYISKVAYIQKIFNIQLIYTDKQEVLIKKIIGCARFVYNPFLALKKELYSTNDGCLKQEKQLVLDM